MNAASLYLLMILPMPVKVMLVVLGVPFFVVERKVEARNVEIEPELMEKKQAEQDRNKEE